MYTIKDTHAHTLLSRNACRKLCHVTPAGSFRSGFRHEQVIVAMCFAALPPFKPCDCCIRKSAQKFRQALSI